MSKLDLTCGLASFLIANSHTMTLASYQRRTLKKWTNQLFSFYKKKYSSAIVVSGKTALVVSITRNGEVLYTDDVVKKYPKDHLEGKVFEVAFQTQEGNPYFAYYLCDDYYFQVTNCLLYTSPSPRDQRGSRMPSSA